MCGSIQRARIRSMQYLVISSPEMYTIGGALILPAAVARHAACPPRSTPLDGERWREWAPPRLRRRTREGGLARSLSPAEPLRSRQHGARVG